VSMATRVPDNLHSEDAALAYAASCGHTGIARQEFRWTRLSGDVSVVKGPWRFCSAPRSDFAEDLAELKAWARGCGWTPPSWWQWWRVGDTR